MKSQRLGAPQEEIGVDLSRGEVMKKEGSGVSRHILKVAVTDSRGEGATGI